jgi:hypothetical protein
MKLRTSRTAIVAALAVAVMLVLPTLGTANEDGRPRLAAVYMSQDGYLLAMAVSLGSVSAYIDYSGVLLDLRIVTLGDEDYSYSVGESQVDHVGDVPVECYSNPPGPKQVGFQRFEYRTSEHTQLSRIGNMEIQYAYVTAELELPVAVGEYSVEYRPQDGKLARFGGASFDYGAFSKDLESISGSVSENSDVEIHVIAEICD